MVPVTRHFPSIKRVTGSIYPTLSLSSYQNCYSVFGGWHCTIYRMIKIRQFLFPRLCQPTGLYPSFSPDTKRFYSQIECHIHGQTNTSSQVTGCATESHSAEPPLSKRNPGRQPQLCSCLSQSLSCVPSPFLVGLLPLHSCFPAILELTVCLL